MKMARFTLPRPFRTAFGVLYHLDRVFLRVQDEAVVGWGEAAIDFPFSPYDQFDVFDSLRTLLCRTQTAQALRNAAAQLPWPAAQAAADMAILDIESQKAGVPLVEYLSLAGSSAAVPPLMSIGIQRSAKATAGEAMMAVRKGFAPKLKLGARVAIDLEVVAAVIRRLPASVGVGLDANAAYPAAQAVALATGLRGHATRVLFLEQPSRTEEGPEFLAELSQAVPFPIVADESCDTPAAARALANAGVALNLKASKLGGVSCCVSIAREVSVPVMVGGTFGTDLHRAYDQIVLRALRVPLPSDACMPACAYFPDPAQRTCVHRLSGLGIGLEVNESSLAKLAVGNPADEYRRLRSENGAYQAVTARPWNWNL